MDEPEGVSLVLSPHCLQQVFKLNLIFRLIGVG